MSTNKPRKKVKKRTVKFRRLTSKVKKIAQTALRRCERKRPQTHRPTVTIVFRYRGPGWKMMKKSRFLIIWSKDDGTGENPGLVKGGVEVGEKLFAAGFRESAEEVGMSREHIFFRGYGGTRSVRSLKCKGGFPKKLYVILYADYTGPKRLTINPNELSRCAWLTDVEIDKTLCELRAKRPVKETVLREALAAVMPLLLAIKKEAA